MPWETPGPSRLPGIAITQSRTLRGTHVSTPIAPAPSRAHGSWLQAMSDSDWAGFVGGGQCPAPLQGTEPPTVPRECQASTARIGSASSQQDTGQPSRSSALSFPACWGPDKAPLPCGRALWLQPMPRGAQSQEHSQGVGEAGAGKAGHGVGAWAESAGNLVLRDARVWPA